ncbi:MAG TPA: DUF6526 family protein [Bryobacteraceae bacterium]|jgi:hypothetical protein|nr:DUF6526 family protein [Bryobacteraceae bacterium]
MAQQKTQNFQNHARVDPLFHFFLAPVALLIVIGSVYELVRDPGWVSGAHVVGAIWAFVALFKLRLYPLKVQDRVIRLEERLRMEKLLPEPWKSRIPELSEAQLIALRFASDAELPDLVEKTLGANLEPKAIKQSIRNWRPDYLRV